MLGLSTAMLGVALGSRVVGGRAGRRGRAARDWRPANPVLFVAVGASALLLVAAVSLRPLQELLQTTRPGPLGFAAAVAAAAVSFAATRSVTRVRRP